MPMARIKKDDLVKIIAGKNKGTTGKVIRVTTKDNTALVDGVGVSHRHVKPSRQNPRGGSRDIHVPISLHKLALVTDEKSSVTSRVGFTTDTTGTKQRLARQNNNKEIK